MPLVLRWVTLVRGYTFAEGRHFNVVREQEQHLVSLSADNGESRPTPLSLVDNGVRPNAQDQRRVNPRWSWPSLEFGKRPFDRFGQCKSVRVVVAPLRRRRSPLSPQLSRFGAP
jgi:hypothetical protein